MTIKKLNLMTYDEASEIKHLILRCNSYDNLNGFMDIDASLNFNQEMKSIYLYYQNDKLVSALTLFMPSGTAAELSAMTLPKYRRKGYFKQLVKEAEAELKSYSVSELLFVCDSRSVHGKAAIEKQKAAYAFSEYLMKYGHALDKEIKEYKYRLALRRAEDKDLEKAIQISMDIFKDSYEDAASIIKNTITSDNRALFLCYFGDMLIGMAGYSITAGSASINGLGILPEHQGKDFGREMLFQIIKELMDHNIENIFLEVDEDNAKALELYKKSGFEVENSWDYFRKTI